MATKRETLDSLINLGYLKSKKIIKVFEKVDRTLFVPKSMLKCAWIDTPLPIGSGQTISAPHMYAIMLEAIDLKEGQKVLEVGSGSGYGAALIREIIGPSGRVITIERIKELSEFASENLKKAGYEDILVVHGDGSKGYEKEKPYDRIIITAACDEVPNSLVEQLKINGKLIAPVGHGIQDLILLEKRKDRIIKKNLGGCVFVPLVNG